MINFKKYIIKIQKDFLIVNMTLLLTGFSVLLKGLDIISFATLGNLFLIIIGLCIISFVILAIYSDYND